MKVTHVAISPTEAAANAGRPALTPELLAACGARYSRNDEGLNGILAKIDPDNLDKSVDSIFRMVDYGHQSIADMVPVAMFIDGISIWLAYYIWSLCPTASGQETSTRYVKVSSAALINPEILGIPATLHGAWRIKMDVCFKAYLSALAHWEQIVATDPTVARIPSVLLNDSSDKARKQVARMTRNYAFDRARYFLPVAAATNVMLLMSARSWVQLCQYLLSHPVPEVVCLGEAIRSELNLCAPRMLRHAVAKDYMQQGIKKEYEELCRLSQEQAAENLQNTSIASDAAPTPLLDVTLPPEVSEQNLVDDLLYHSNRYAWVGSRLRRTAVRFGWNAVAMAELRDLNRHRTGTKYAPLVPVGFYCAQEQLPPDQFQRNEDFRILSGTGREVTCEARSYLSQSNDWYIYWTLLGTQYRFEHLTTGDKFIYEAELRTGSGSHFRYAKHLADVLRLWYTRFPKMKGVVLEGSAEPE